jgi:hypothetical protein
MYGSTLPEFSLKILTNNNFRKFGARHGFLDEKLPYNGQDRSPWSAPKIPG